MVLLPLLTSKIDALAANAPAAEAPQLTRLSGASQSTPPPSLDDHAATDGTSRIAGVQTGAHDISEGISQKQYETLAAYPAVTLSMLFITYDLGAMAQLCQQWSGHDLAILVEKVDAEELFANTRPPYGLLPDGRWRAVKTRDRIKRTGP